MRAAPRALLRRRIALRLLAALPSGFTVSEATRALQRGPWADHPTGICLVPASQLSDPYPFLRELIADGILDVAPWVRDNQAHAYFWVDEDA